MKSLLQKIWPLCLLVAMASMLLAIALCVFGLLPEQWSDAMRSIADKLIL